MIELLPYKAYTQEFDREVLASDLMREAHSVIEILEEFHRSLREPSDRQLTIPDHFGDTPLVTLLIDLSRSMQGHRAEWVFLAVHQVGKALTQANINFEILGFTTREWEGGQSRQKWEIDGHPPFPGRLNDLLHIVFKSGDDHTTNWVQSLALLFDKDIFKENIDGEALLWASDRAQSLRPSYWLCLVISDGSPVDDSTLLANESDLNFEDASILTRHLKSALHELDQVPNTELAGISLETDANHYYPVSKNLVSALHKPSELLVFLEALMAPSDI